MADGASERDFEFANLTRAIPYASYLGVEVDRDERGVLSRLPFREGIIGNHTLPAVHGGVVGAFLELAALYELLAQERTTAIPKPIDFNVNYLRAAGPRDLKARATVVKHGRRIANVQVVAWQDDADKPVASGHGNFLFSGDLGDIALPGGESDDGP